MLLGLILSIVLGVLFLLLFYSFTFYYVEKGNLSAAGVMGLLIILTYLGAGLSTLIYFVLWIKSLF